MEDKKTKAGSIAVGICIFIIAVLLVVIVLGFQNSNMEKNNAEEEISNLEKQIEILNKEKGELQEKINEVTKILNNDSSVSEKAKEEEDKLINKITDNNNEISTIEEYFHAIEPYGYHLITFPEFSNIDDANKEWIYSTAIKLSDVNIYDNKYMPMYVSTKDKLNENINYLFGNTSIKFVKPDVDKYLIEESPGYAGIYCYLGYEMSGPEIGVRIIKSINQKGDIFEIKFAECVIYNNLEAKLLDVDGNTIKEFYNDTHGLDYDKINDEIKDYINKNMDKINTKLLKVKYEKNLNQYHAISCERINNK